MQQINVYDMNTYCVPTFVKQSFAALLADLKDHEEDHVSTVLSGAQSYNLPQTLEGTLGSSSANLHNLIRSAWTSVNSSIRDPSVALDNGWSGYYAVALPRSDSTTWFGCDCRFRRQEK